MNKRLIKTLVGVTLLGGFFTMVMLSFGEKVGGYMSFEEAAASGAEAHVVGQWVPERPVHYDPARNVFSFYMRDAEGVVRRVEYPNLKPANFEDAEQLVVMGRMEGEVFHAREILMKCPSKYNDMRALESSGTPSRTTRMPTLPNE
ncbi:cytochrome c maturation protein CcmE domain-containing protein [Rhodothermus profundi]|uniref:Cytochrome c-type biogenesis protein CcmE n=1 Tax=Rhodothermus profundi TaxID=633813 RepID=A0A1M6RV74_9BACT|nr:cytochrome c maturation protein CcmE [Rhodothermus profundi]SHK36345.1 cytochrome c-type biogenesis protein CcmE [Rhodothermus profundi]